MEHFKYVRTRKGFPPIGSICFNTDTGCVGVTVRSDDDQYNRKEGRRNASYRAQYAAWRKNGSGVLTIAMPPIPPETTPFSFDRWKWTELYLNAINFAVKKLGYHPAEISTLNVPMKIVDDAAEVLGFKNND